jgi:hypothetical protein
MSEGKEFNSLIEEMLDLAGIPLDEKEDKKEDEVDSEVDTKEPDAKEDEVDSEDTEDDKETKGEVSDEWIKKIAGQELKMTWKNNDKVLRIRFKGGDTKEWKIPTRLVDNPNYRKPFKAFILKMINYMSGIDSE